MNHDEIFEQRWEFRRKEVDGYTSSDDNGSNSNGTDPANRDHKLVFVENDDPECEMRHEKVEETKNDSKKKKKPEVNRNKRKRKVDNNETMTLKDLKKFASSLMHELSVTRENMFAHMREEMRNLASSKSNLLPIKKNAENESRRTNKQQKGNKLRPSDSNHRLVSSSNIPPPNPQFQTQRNGHKNMSSGLEIEIGKRFSHRIAEFRPQEWLGSYSHNHQNSCIQGIGFPIPLIQGTSNASNTSSLTYCDNNGVGVRMNARFPARWT